MTTKVIIKVPFDSHRKIIVETINGTEKTSENLLAQGVEAEFYLHDYQSLFISEAPYNQ